MARKRKRTNPETRAQVDALFKEAIVLVPLTYNDGSTVPLETIQEIQDDIYLAFHGWTIEGTVKGAYRMQTGQKQTEDLLKISIILDGRLLSQLEAMVARWCGLLGQEVMLLKVTDSIVKFIPPV